MNDKQQLMDTTNNRLVESSPSNFVQGADLYDEDSLMSRPPSHLPVISRLGSPLLIALLSCIFARI